MSTEYLDIPHCPRCGGSHRYKLSVDRAMVFKMLTMADMNERRRQVAITRLFTCPTKNEDFEATFNLTDTSSDRIKNVDVVGVTDGDQ